MINNTLPTKKEIARWSKKKIEKLFPDSNTFTTEVDVSLPEEYKRSLDVWLNLQHTGKRIFGGDDTDIPDALKEASYNLHKCRRRTLKWKIDKFGNWEFLGML